MAMVRSDAVRAVFFASTLRFSMGLKKFTTAPGSASWTAKFVAGSDLPQAVSGTTVVQAKAASRTRLVHPCDLSLTMRVSFLDESFNRTFQAVGLQRLC